MPLPTVNTSHIPLKSRKAAFAALVAAQDGGGTVPASRQAVAEEYGLQVWDVASIEEEGIKKGRPPLD